jgi:hypothetical protein
MFQAVVLEVPNTEICDLIVSGRDVILKGCVLLAVCLTAAATRHVIHSTVLNCCCQCGYGSERDTEATSVVNRSIDYEDAFHEGWIWQDTEYVNFSCYVSVDSEVTICSDWSSSELCNDCEHCGRGGTA